MDGRQFKLKSWCLFGGLVLSAVGCHNKDTYPQNMLPQGGLSTAPSTGGGMFGAKTKATAPMAGSPMESVVSTPRKKGPLLPDTEVAMAETHLQIALNDPPPPNKDEMLDMARARYQRALKQNPKHKDALLGVARMYAKLGDKVHAAEAYDRYLKIYPKDAEVLHELAMKRAQWKDWAGAIAMCDAALKVDPENRTYCKTLGFCQARIGKWDDAYATLAKIMPPAAARHNLAGILDHLGQAEASKQQLQLALQADPGYAPSKEFLTELNEGNAVEQAGYVAQPK